MSCVSAAVVAELAVAARRGLAATAWAAVLAVLAGALAPPALAGEPADAGVLRVGVVLPLEGTHGRLGEAALDGLEWALETAAPGVRVELEVRDSGGSAEIAAAQVAALAGDAGIVAILGPLGVAEAEAAAAAAESGAVPLLTLTSAEDIELAGAWIFRLRLSPEDQARALAAFAVDALELERAAVFYPEHDYGRGCARAFAEAFAAAGGRITAYEGYAPDDSRPAEEAELLAGRRVRRLGRDTDAPPSTTTRKRGAAHVDFEALFVPEVAEGVARDLAFLELAGVELDGGLQLLGTSAWASGSLAGTEGRASGALVARLFDPLLDEAVEARVAQFVERHERQPTELEAQAHDGMLLLLSALERCGAERGCVQQRLRSGAAVDGVTGRVALTAEGGLRREIFLFAVDAAGEMAPAY